MFGLPGVSAEDVPLWYGVIFMVNMQMAFLSPPFGYSLFYLKSVAPPEITMATIFRAAVNFMALQWLGVGLCILFPQIIVWLPRLLFRASGLSEFTPKNIRLLCVTEKEGQGAQSPN